MWFPRLQKHVLVVSGHITMFGQSKVQNVLSKVQQHVLVVSGHITRFGQSKVQNVLVHSSAAVRRG